jgi:lactobin A/cerein 7B family class IIb bacteriocin
MQELTVDEIVDVSGGKTPWLLILNAAADFFEGFSDGYKAPK